MDTIVCLHWRHYHHPCNIVCPANHVDTLGFDFAHSLRDRSNDEWLDYILSQDVIRLNKLHATLQLDP